MFSINSTGSIELKRIAVVGAGAAGVMTAIRVAERARGPVEILLIDPAVGEGRGRAYATGDHRHRLNVRADRMSVDENDPLDFVRWLGETVGRAEPGDFVFRGHFGRYLADRLRQAVRDNKLVRLHRVDAEVVAVDGTALRFANRSTVDVDAAVLAVGVFPPGCAWAPDDLRNSVQFVADPWAPEALGAVPATGDVLLVGTGLTMVDMALSLASPGRTVHAVSRRGLLPRVHAPATSGATPPVGLAGLTGLLPVRRAIRQHVEAKIRAGGDWQSALDDIRPLTQRLWAGMPLADRERFLDRDRRFWDVHRHRMPVDTAIRIDDLRARGLLVVHTGAVADACRDDTSWRVRLSSGRAFAVSAVVNCTGAQEDVRKAGNPLLDHLLATGAAQPGPLGLGLRTAADGRITPAGRPSGIPLWTLGALRRGDLWETTAFAEIRAQAGQIADSLRYERDDIQEVLSR